MGYEFRSRQTERENQRLRRLRHLPIADLAHLKKKRVFPLLVDYR